MIAKVMRGRDTRALLDYLYGPGRANEHIDPHLVAAWRNWGVHDPGRTATAAIPDLARRLDRFILPGGPRHVWHCAVRIAHEDRALTDPEWADIAHRLTDAAGIAPAGDPRACRWIAVRHDGAESHHIHLVATLARQDGRLPGIHNDALRLRHACRSIENRLRLRTTGAPDRTSTPQATRAERERAIRAERPEPSRRSLARVARRCAATAESEAGYFAALTASGVLVHRHHTDSVLDGYALSWPHDLNSTGHPVWFSGAKLAPDLTLPRIRARFPTPAHNPVEPGWAALAAAAGGAHTHWGTAGPGHRAATAAALGDALSAAAAAAPPDLHPELSRADDLWGQAARPPLRPFDHTAASALRHAARHLPGPNEAPQAGIARTRSAFATLAASIAAWYAQRGWGPHEHAARAAHAALAR